MGREKIIKAAVVKSQNKRLPVFMLLRKSKEYNRKCIKKTLLKNKKQLNKIKPPRGLLFAYSEYSPTQHHATNSYFNKLFVFRKISESQGERGKSS